MEIEGKEMKKQPDNYFNSIIFFFRLAGVPFNMNKISAIYGLYMITVIFCSCSTFIGIGASVYLHRDDLGHIMTNMRVLMPLLGDITIYVYCR
jgi:ABC-type phosphate transport system permease subunit